MVDCLISGFRQLLRRWLINKLMFAFLKIHYVYFHPGPRVDSCNLMASMFNSLVLPILTILLLYVLFPLTSTYSAPKNHGNLTTEIIVKRLRVVQVDTVKPNHLHQRDKCSGNKNQSATTSNVPKSFLTCNPRCIIPKLFQLQFE